MIRFFCECGRQLQAGEASIGQPAKCPICGRVTTVPESDTPRTPERPSAEPPRPSDRGEITRREPAEAPAGRYDDLPPRREEWDDDVPHRRPRSPFVRRETGTCQDATTAMILGLVGLFCCALASPVAIILGVRALNKIKQSEGDLTGTGQAITGIVLGSISLALVAVQILLIVMG